MNALQHKVSIARLTFWVWRKRRRGNRYLKTLSDAERTQFMDGTHPSLSHENVNLAEPIAKLLQEKFTSEGHEAAVEVGLYHGDRLIFHAAFRRCLPRKRKRPEWFKGYEVFYSVSEPDTLNGV
ncbi:MAG: hypothetical protein AAF593_04260 [Planctomycetota bacterium]